MTLTPQQISAVQRGEPVRLFSEEVGQEVVLLRGDQFRSVARYFDDWDPRCMQHVMIRLMQDGWTDPAGDVYAE